MDEKEMSDEEHQHLDEELEDYHDEEEQSADMDLDSSAQAIQVLAVLLLNHESMPITSFSYSSFFLQSLLHKLGVGMDMLHHQAANPSKLKSILEGLKATGCKHLPSFFFFLFIS